MKIVRDNDMITTPVKKADYPAVRRVLVALEVDWASLHKILSDTTRRSILELLAEKESLTYTDMMTLLQITNTGRLNYHLKVLGSLISKDEGGRYRLTEQGRQAASLLRTFPERVPPERKLTGVKVATAVVLILIGVLLISSLRVCDPSRGPPTSPRARAAGSDPRPCRRTPPSTSSAGPPPFRPSAWRGAPRPGPHLRPEPDPERRAPVQPFEGGTARVQLHGPAGGVVRGSTTSSRGT